MIVPLRSARFMLPDRSASVYVEMRRHHNIKTSSVDNQNRAFTVIKRYSNMPKVISRRTFGGSGAQSEARKYWTLQTVILEDQGLQRCTDTFVGFHEED